jgi:hypothetical protein
MKPVKIKTTWGTIELMLDGNGNVVQLILPPLEDMPRREFAFFDKTTDFQALEKKFPNLGIPPGTEFQMAVWNELKKIPRGQTLTYSQIATAIGRPKAVRAAQPAERIRCRSLSPATAWLPPAAPEVSAAVCRGNDCC